MITTNLTFGTPTIVDESLTLVVASNTPEGGYYLFDSVEDIIHNDGQEILHPTYSALGQFGQSAILTEGAITLTYTLNPETKDEAIEQYLEYISDIAPNASFSYTDTELVASYDVEFTQTTWSIFKDTYYPRSTSIRLDLKEGSELACFLRVDGSPEAWTVEYKDILPNTLTTIEKEGENCYIFFSKEVTKDSTTLSSYSYYKLTSGDIEVTSTEPCKAIRLYRD